MAYENSEGVREMKKGKRLTSVSDEHEVRERLRKTTPTVKESLKVQWVGLTEEEMETLYYGNADTITGTERNFGRAVEAALKEKNNG